MTPSEEILVAIVDDNRLVREAIASILNRLPDMRVVETSVSNHPRSGVDAMHAELPHVVLLDAGLSDQDSLDAARELVARLPGARVIVMDLLPVSEEITEFINVGVSGFVLKDSTFDEFVATIRAVAGGESVLPPSMTQSLFAQIAQEAALRGVHNVIDDVRLTPREREVIDLIGEGLSNKEIAHRLTIATHTVKSHVRNVMEKLALHTRLQISAYFHTQA